MKSSTKYSLETLPFTENLQQKRKLHLSINLETVSYYIPSKSERHRQDGTDASIHCIAQNKFRQQWKNKNTSHL